MDKLYDGTYHRTRTRSPRNLVAEIEQVVSRYPTEFLAFRESIFPLKKKWLVQFAQLMKEKVNLPFYCHLRLDLLDAEKVVLLKEAGCHSVNVGIEAGRADIRNRLLGRPMSDETIVNSCQLLRKAGIKILANNMLGLPSTGFSHDWDTLKLNQRAKPHYSLAMLWQPYPGTRLAKFAEDNNWFNGNLDDLEFSYYNNSHIRFETPEDKSRIENLQRLFAVAAKYPLLSPLFKQITRLPKNKVFDTIFKTVYLVYHQSEIFPHKISPKSWVTHLRGLLE